MPSMPAEDPFDAIDPEPLSRACGVASLEHLPEATSTMDRARAIAEDADAQVPAIVVADRQTRGRGRRGAGWWQAPGSLAASLIFDAESLGGPEPLPRWSLACGIAVAEAVRQIEPAIDPRVRWPNDVEVAGRKLAGILVETAGCNRVIFGIGVNTTGTADAAPEGVRHRVVTVPDLVGRAVPRGPLLERIVAVLVPLCRAVAARPDVLVDRYAPLCGLAGREVRLHVGGDTVDGACEGIAPDGSILLRTPDGLRAFASGSLAAPGTEWRGGME